MWAIANPSRKLTVPLGIVIFYNSEQLQGKEAERYQKQPARESNTASDPGKGKPNRTKELSCFQ